MVEAMAMSVRQPAVAGLFYPGGAAGLRRTVKSLLDEARLHHQPPERAPKALIVPHAGYVYSGPTAARGYLMVEPWRDRFARVVLLGPAHHVGFAGLALSGASAFATPLGEVPLDAAGRDLLTGLPGVVTSAAAHAPEHSLEVQVPFLQLVLDQFELVPLVVGDASPEQVAGVLEACWGGPETLLVISSDLSHYLPYADAVEVDARTVSRILALEWPLPRRSACGGRAIDGLLLAARRHGLEPTLVDARNSGDTAGDHSRVVGYASFTFTEAGDGH
jgi:AmmeMemoRadiSam system protein B